MTFLEKTHPNALMEGELIGNNPNNKIQTVKRNLKINLDFRLPALGPLNGIN